MNLVTDIKPKIKSTNCAAMLVNTLIELGVDSIFGYPGAAVLSIYNELAATNKITHYLVRHEQAAVHAAEGYARVSGKVGVVLVTSGPGFTNTITGIANAYADSTPLVVLAGDVSPSKNDGKVFQNIDIISMVKTCSKKCYKLLGNDDIAAVLKTAFEEANSGVKGPVVISLPRKFLEAKYVKMFSRKNHLELSKQEKNVDYSKLKDMINLAERPLLLIGGGCINASLEVKKLCSKHLMLAYISYNYRFKFFCIF